MCVIKASYLHLEHSGDVGMYSCVMHFLTNRLLISKTVQNHVAPASYVVVRMKGHAKP